MKLLQTLKSKLKFKTQTKSPRGFTLIETLAATGIASIVITSALGVVGTIYFTQKRVQFSQDFYAESRYLMETIAQIARNHTLDYDRFFVEEGPAISVCATFNADQIPNSAAQNNDRSNRTLLTYPSVFYWDTNGDGDQDRNLGGMDTDGLDPDACTQAWNNANTLDTLYLINSSRTQRKAIAFDGTNNVTQLETQIGADTDNDGKPDTWGPYDANGDGNYLAVNDDVKVQWDSTQSRCEILYDQDNDNVFDDFPIYGDATDEDFCDQAHAFTTISPIALKVNNLSFMPSPNRDPFLGFRVNESQIHPHVFISLAMELRNPDQYGFEAILVPKLSFQTVVSSRVFGNIRG